MFFIDRRPRLAVIHPQSATTSLKSVANVRANRQARAFRCFSLVFFSGPQKSPPQQLSGPSGSPPKTSTTTDSTQSNTNANLEKHGFTGVFANGS